MASHPASKQLGRKSEGPRTGSRVLPAHTSLTLPWPHLTLSISCPFPWQLESYRGLPMPHTSAHSFAITWKRLAVGTLVQLCPSGVNEFDHTTSFSLKDTFSSSSLQLFLWETISPKLPFSHFCSHPKPVSNLKRACGSPEYPRFALSAFLPRAQVVCASYLQRFWWRLKWGRDFSGRDKPLDIPRTWPLLPLNPAVSLAALSHSTLALCVPELRTCQVKPDSLAAFGSSALGS